MMISIIFLGASYVLNPIESTDRNSLYDLPDETYTIVAKMRGTSGKNVLTFSSEDGEHRNYRVIPSIDWARASDPDNHYDIEYDDTAFVSGTVFDRFDVVSLWTR